jgi:hypothetical protein
MVQQAVSCPELDQETCTIEGGAVFLTQLLITLCAVALLMPQDGSGPKNGIFAPAYASLSALSLPPMPTWPGTSCDKPGDAH